MICAGRALAQANDALAELRALKAQMTNDQAEIDRLRNELDQETQDRRAALDAGEQDLAKRGGAPIHAVCSGHVNDGRVDRETRA
jgi:hypothetical protein